MGAATHRNVPLRPYLDEVSVHAAAHNGALPLELFHQGCPLQPRALAQAPRGQAAAWLRLQQLHIAKQTQRLRPLQLWPQLGSAEHPHLPAGVVMDSRSVAFTGPEASQPACSFQDGWIKQMAPT
jgi:hypothetical protein